MATWRRYEELRPDELATCVSQTPVVFWPLGLLEHHGWHLPVGFDGMKAERMCMRMAEQTGGVLLPTMWWGGGGGHDMFHWTFYQDESAYTQILVETTQKLIAYGFRAIVILAGHYPWRKTLEERLPEIREAHPEILLLFGTEVTIVGDAVNVKGDHAAKEETSYGLSLFPERIDMDAMRSGRGDEVWPNRTPPPEDRRHSRVRFDPNDPLFAQMGEDSREASAAHGEAGVLQVVNEVVARIQRHLGG
ncbi:MAG: creatininase family protein [bacterium]|nr:creatininase family protein [bacterium]